MVRISFWRSKFSINLSYSVVQPSVLIHLDSFIEKNSIPINFKSQANFLLIWHFFGIYVTLLYQPKNVIKKTQALGCVNL